MKAPAALAFILMLLAPGGPWAARQYYHSDRLGSVQMMTNESGVRVEAVVHQPYGTALAYGRDGNHLLGPTSPFGFTGHRSVDASGLIYMNARYYDPELGLFVSHDPRRQFPNPYSYGDGDPLNAVDPTGGEVISPSEMWGGGEVVGPSAGSGLGSMAVGAMVMGLPNFESIFFGGPSRVFISGAGPIGGGRPLNGRRIAETPLRDAPSAPVSARLRQPRRPARLVNIHGEPVKIDPRRGTKQDVFVLFYAPKAFRDSSSLSVIKPQATARNQAARATQVSIGPKGQVVVERGRRIAEQAAEGAEIHPVIGGVAGQPGWLMYRLNLYTDPLGHLRNDINPRWIGPRLGHGLP